MQVDKVLLFYSHWWEENDIAHLQAHKWFILFTLVKKMVNQQNKNLKITKKPQNLQTSP